MSSLEKLLHKFRTTAQSEREKGTYFENLMRSYFVTEAYYKDQYREVLTYAEWARRNNFIAKDTGIDLVAITYSDENHAIQCKLYAPDYKLQKTDIDSFFTASGKKYFSHRIIVSTTSLWSDNALDALENQEPEVTKIDLHDLEQSQIDWERYLSEQKIILRPKKILRKHQTAALNSVIQGFETANRGKLIMACGTGKTFTSLKIAETLTGNGGRVLFLVPSLSLLSQTLTEWTQESAIPLHSFAVCSDSDVGKKKGKDEVDDNIGLLAHELQYPATTNPQTLAREFRMRHDSEHMSVVFSTYHSIEVVGLAQKNHLLPEFDLIVCDEAHRTTGAKFEDIDESSFIKVHDGDFLKARKRLYMTATPRIYADVAKDNAKKDNVALCSMDDEKLYGKELHVITFSEAVKLGLLVDYKVIVLAVEESHVNRRIQGLLSDENNQLKVDDAAKIVGCWKALAKFGVTHDIIDDPSPMRRAVAFCQVIEPTKKTKGHKVASKNIASMFQAVVEAYQEQEDIEEEVRLKCEAQHVDGSMGATLKEEKLDWLKAETPNNTCRILSNVRCLSEGVDVPALDAVLFLTPRNSQVDVVQSVGRVMRKDPSGKKKRGYVILPVVIPAGVESHVALNDNKTYAVVWQVLQALRSHDDRFDAMVNKMDLELNRSILAKMEVISICDKVPTKKSNNSSEISEKTGKPKAKNRDTGRSEYNIGMVDTPSQPDAHQSELQFEIGEIEKAIYAKVVQKCGNRHHWEDWANDIAKIARTHIDRITGILENPKHATERQAFKAFADELRDDLNNSITDDEIVEMLAQHMITKPVFDALFSGYSFASKNPISTAMQGVLNALNEHSLDKETDTLEKFYESVRYRAMDIENAEGKQKIVVELYDKFFRNAFPRMTERLGIVYTPVEVVDFIIHSVDHLLKSEFGISLGAKGVHIIDPFTGTGTFITRLIQSGLISVDELPHKFHNEIHANEIVLLAYYIAAINIEAVYHSIIGGNYVPFEGICLTDTFQLYEKEDLINAILVDNSARRSRQKKLDIQIIIGNPPYSAGQDSENKNNANYDYPYLDERIRSTYAKKSSATLSKGLYDSYIRAIRWASDRIGKSGIIGFVTNAGYIESSSADGLRMCLAEEFSSIWIFHLRGNQRTQGEQSHREGGKIFGSGSRAPIAISLLVKNPNSQLKGQIRFCDIGDYLDRDKKLEIIASFESVEGISKADRWVSITPDIHGDWINQRNNSFTNYVVIGDKSKSEPLAIFKNYSQGLLSARDSWCFNSDKKSLEENICKLLSVYNQERSRFQLTFPIAQKAEREKNVDDFVTSDPSLISWTGNLKKDLVNDRIISQDMTACRRSLYRPFTKQWLYFNRKLNERVYQLPEIFPYIDSENLVICTTGIGSKVFSTLISNITPCYDNLQKGQCFPLYLYEESQIESDSLSLFEEDKKSNLVRRDAITDEGYNHYKEAYPSERFSKEDIFYYIYGLLHSEDYRSRFGDNLSKEFPRIPCVKQAEDFWTFSKAGRDLAHWHLHYETIEPYKAELECNRGDLPDEIFYRVEKMKYASKEDKTRLIYNSYITVSGIPLEAYEYFVNGKSALDWVVERQCVKIDKDSGIVNDANLWATKTMCNPAYPLELFLRVITVSLKTREIVKKLPILEI